MLLIDMLNILRVLQQQHKEYLFMFEFQTSPLVIANLKRRVGGVLYHIKDLKLHPFPATSRELLNVVINSRYLYISLEMWPALVLWFIFHISFTVPGLNHYQFRSMNPTQ